MGADRIVIYVFSKGSIETFNIGILGWFAWLDEGYFDGISRNITIKKTPVVT